MLPLLHTGQIRRQSAVQPSAGCRRLRAVCLSKRRSPQPVSWRVHAASAEVAEESAVPTPSEERGAEETSTSYDDSDLVFEIPDWIKKRNAEFAEEISGKLILAPLTKASADILSHSGPCLAACCPPILFVCSMSFAYTCS